MRRAERIVDVKITEARQLFRETLVVFLFLLMKAQVLEQQHVAVFERINFRLRRFARTVFRESDLLIE